MKSKETSNLSNLLNEMAETELYLDDSELQQEFTLNEDNIKTKASTIRNELLSNALQCVSESNNKTTDKKKSSGLKGIFNQLSLTNRSKPIFANKRKKKK